MLAATMVNHINTKPMRPSQRLIGEVPDGSCTLQTEVIVNLEMYSVFMSYGPGIKVISPPQRRQPR